jgi:hypothetical protein
MRPKTTRTEPRERVLVRFLAENDPLVFSEAGRLRQFDPVEDTERGCYTNIDRLAPSQNKEDNKEGFLSWQRLRINHT